MIKFNTILIFCFCINVLIGFIQAGITEVDEWTRRKDYYYYFTDHKIADGRGEFCEAVGANVLSIANSDEQSFINSKIDIGYWISLYIRGEGCDDCSNGQENDACRQCRNKWQWRDETQSSYKNWVTNQPNDANKQCARLQADGKWKVASCSGGSGYNVICKRTDPCRQNSPCHHGSCHMVLTSEKYECRCHEGYTGKHCKTDIDECEGVICYHDGTCEDLIAQYKCHCPSAWTGSNCQFDVDECEEDARLCQNGGTCNNYNGGYRCDCVDGFTGRNCETNIDECESVFCQNNGQCKDGINMYTCECTAYWTGKHCETDIDECSEENRPNYCANGHCTNRNEGYNCTCYDGYHGNTCDKHTKDEDLTVLRIIFIIAATLFAISFTAMVVMAFLDILDVKRLKKQKREEREEKGSAEETNHESNPLISKPSTSRGTSVNDTNDREIKLETMYTNVAKHK